MKLDKILYTAEVNVTGGREPRHSNRPRATATGRCRLDNGNAPLNITSSGYPPARTCNRSAPRDLGPLASMVMDQG
jgi:hypothetical protein